jgi:multicomponent Na+:H+ antiporter subunit D
MIDWVEWIHPGLVLIFGAALVPFLKGRAKKVSLIAIPGIALLCCILSSEGSYGNLSVLGYELVFGRVDRLSLIFSYVFSIMAVVGFVYALHVKDDGQHMAALVYAGSALGVTFAGDLLTLFLFWELLAFSSVFLVWLKRSKEASGAGSRYLLVHVAGGLCLLAGIGIHFAQTGSIAFDSMAPFAGGPAFYCILIGFILNAAVPPLGAWLADAYPEATVTGAVFMTAFTTKSAVYVLIRAFPGTELLVWLGAVMAIYGVVYAVLENDARRLLAYHIISQVGYMVCGVGLGTTLALNGASAHAFAHILYKALLFMGAGAVMYTTGKRKLNELGGMYKSMPITMTLYMIGGFSISAVPLFSGFVSKSMVVTAAADDHRQWIFLMLTLASSGTFLHTGLKLPYYMFFGKDAGIRTDEAPKNMLIAMGLLAVLCIMIGVFPGVLYTLLPFEADYVPYTAHHVVSTLGLLGFTALGFFLLLRQLDPTPTISLDTDWFYRKGAKSFVRFVAKPVTWIDDNVVGQAYEWIVRGPVLGAAQLFRKTDTRAVDGTVHALGAGTLALSSVLRILQSGQIHHYAIVLALGALVLIVTGLVVL